jgi:hypothetical protein
VFRRPRQGGLPCSMMIDSQMRIGSRKCCKWLRLRVRHVSAAGESCVLWMERNAIWAARAEDCEASTCAMPRMGGIRRSYFPRAAVR